ncbi:DUF4234 domain-containing protein [Cohnella soli]|uniref:DUF4234 domain-containing protein n=1 Tax=Cohnella soli TaxID=425005 RepID=A0ABW0HWB0_9BACL
MKRGFLVHSGKHFLLTLVTCGIWTFIWAYQIGQKVAEAQRQRDLPVTDNSVLYVIYFYYPATKKGLSSHSRPLNPFS